MGNGSRLAYISNRTGKFEVWVRDLETGAEHVVTRTAKPIVFAAISRDGKRLAYQEGADVYVVPVGGGVALRLCTECGRPDDWSPEQKILGSMGSTETGYGGIGAWDPSMGSWTKIVAYEAIDTYSPKAPSVSPDGTWLVFHTGERFSRQIFLAV